MIKFFRRYQKTAFGILILLAALLMISFNVDFSNKGTRSTQAAIKIDDIEISHSDFFSKKRELESRYRQMFGAQYETLAKQFNLNIAQNVVDGMVDNTLLVREAANRGFTASDDAIVAEIAKLFPGGYDASVLRASGKTPDMFLRELDDQMKQEQIENILKDSARSSKKEALALWTEQHTQFDVQYVEFDPKDFAKEVKAPSEEDLKKYYDNHSDEFKLPDRVSYDYIAFRPENFLGEIEVASDEVEFYYTDNQSKFEIPEKLKLRHIQFLYPKESDPKKMAAVKEKAQEALEKAKSGQPFESLVQQYSDDFASRASGGDLGWISKGSRSKEFDDKTYAVKDGGITDLIETDTGFQIVKVEGYKEPSLQPLSEVRGQIETILKDEQAPGYADTKARDFLDLATQSKKPLSELAKEKGYAAASSNGLLADKVDPEPALAGLTAKVLDDYSEDNLKQLVDLKDVTVFVQVKEYKQAEVPPLDTMKEKVLASYKSSQSVSLAKIKAEALLQTLKASEKQNLEAVAKAEKIPVQKKAAVSMTSELTPPLNAPALKQEIFSATTIPSAPGKVIPVAGKYYLVQNISRTVPDIKNAKPEELAKLRDQYSQTMGSVAAKSFSESLKASSKIDIDQAILHSEE